MPRVMSLEGFRGGNCVGCQPPRRQAPGILAGFGATAPGVSPTPLVVAPPSIFSPITSHPFVVIAGLFFGAWLAGTKGKAFLAKHRAKKAA